MNSIASSVSSVCSCIVSIAVGLFVYNNMDKKAMISKLIKKKGGKRREKDEKRKKSISSSESSSSLI